MVLAGRSGVLVISSSSFVNALNTADRSAYSAFDCGHVSYDKCVH